MATLFVFSEDNPASEPLCTMDDGEIARQLAVHGVAFERWDLAQPSPSDASQEQILASYRSNIERLMTTTDYVTVDVVQMHGDAADPEWREKAAEARSKFLAEHTHDDDEVRFFVDGQGAFYLRVGHTVQIVMCGAGDLLALPQGTRHWFDMGANPCFTAIRFFRATTGWVAKFTGDPVAEQFPSLDELLTLTSI
jgi:1,2-dihydroxy-3-keto-5-methylthiopentene dioxygenase